MTAPRDDWRLTAGAVLAGALVALAGGIVVLQRAGLPAGSYIVLAPVLVFAAPLVLALVAWLEPGPERSPGEDLDHLLAQKRAGALPPARRLPSPARSRLPGPRAGRTDPDAAPAEALDRLVRRKRDWTDAGPGPDEPGQRDSR